jgi:hypothetical protein
MGYANGKQLHKGKRGREADMYEMKKKEIKSTEYQTEIHMKMKTFSTQKITKRKNKV